MNQLTHEDFDRYDNNLIFTQFLIGLPMLAVFVLFALPILHNMEINLAFFLGSIMVLGILYLPIKLSYRIIKSPWETKEAEGQ